jgi:AcrR family transcriptional regulator
MGRPPDTDRHDEVLARCCDYVLAHGLAGLSLRPMALALGTSTRMLLYDFSSKEQLVAEVLAEIRRREATMLAANLSSAPRDTSELLRVVWSWISAPERDDFLRLFFQVYVDAATRPDAYGTAAKAMVNDWLETVAALIGGFDPVPPVSATLLVAVVRGLLLDELATGDRARANLAMGQFVALVEGQGRHPAS